MAYYKLQYEKVVTYNIPLTSGEYAPEVHHIKGESARAIIGIIRGVLEAVLPAGAVIELWVLKVGAAFTEAHADPANYIFAQNLLSGASISATVTPYVWHVELRAKSGGTAGPAVLHVTAI